MKKITFIAAVFGMLAFTSCGNEATAEETTEEVAVGEANTEEATSGAGDIVGTWKLTDVDFGMEIPEEQKAMFDQMIKSMLENTTMTFNDDGTFESQSKVMGEDKVETGNYTLDGTTLTSINAEGGEDIVNLTELTSEKMSISVEEEGKTITMSFSKQ